jgi:tRNA-dependent cyclodipeptide synthase
MVLENEARHRGLRAVPRGGGLVPGRSCAIGISIGNARCEGDHLAAMVELAAANFERTTLLIGDSLHRLTLRIERGMTPAKAEDEAIAIGRGVERRLEVALPSEDRRFSILLTSQVARLRSFGAALRILSDTVAADEELRRILERDAKEYHERPARMRGTLSGRDRRDFQLSCRYLLEDVALCAVLASDCGIETLIYPGSPPRVLAAAIDGGIRSLKTPLANFRFVPVRFRKRGSHIDDASATAATANQDSTADDREEDRS